MDAGTTDISTEEVETMTEPHWGKLDYTPIDYQSISYFAAPKEGIDSLDEVDPKILEAYNKLGISLEEQKQLAGVKVAVDAVVDSVSVATTYSEELKKHGVIFCSISAPPPFWYIHIPTVLLHSKFIQTLFA